MLQELYQGDHRGDARHNQQRCGGIQVKAERRTGHIVIGNRLRKSISVHDLFLLAAWAFSSSIFRSSLLQLYDTSGEEKDIQPHRRNRGGYPVKREE